MSELNVPLAEDKTVGPVKLIVYLGLELDTVYMVVRIPQSKLNEVKAKILHLLSESKTTLKAMLSLIGSLHFFCRAIIVGRPFIRRFINTTFGLSKPHHHIRIN
jgi:hypothetical protein